jgi:hypothetical protein
MSAFRNIQNQAKRLDLAQSGSIGTFDAIGA